MSYLKIQEISKPYAGFILREAKITDFGVKINILGELKISNNKDNKILLCLHYKPSMLK